MRLSDAPVLKLAEFKILKNALKSSEQVDNQSNCDEFEIEATMDTYK